MRAPDGTIAYHTTRMLAALELAAGDVAPDMAATLAVYHARMAAHLALQGGHR
jgi:hypothetical protein